MKFKIKRQSISLKVLDSLESDCKDCVKVMCLRFASTN